MALSAGTRIGVYEVLAKLGEGGMGEVYRARDTKLGRDVALKFLSETFAGDADRLARFEREARTLASLNHPHIAQVYGFENRALVMELVEGEDLSDCIARGPIPLDEAMPIAQQIAEALETAHDAGIVHRDLKPGNVKVRPDGSVKILDFGLAKPGPTATASSGAFLNSPTITSPAALTMGGMILGTAAYMAPEQAKGKPVDRRADIWAFGCVLYEMLTGQRAFPGEDIGETLASILAREPDFNALPSGLTPALRALIVRCLARDPRERVASISTALYVLKSGLDAVPSPAAAISAPVARRHVLRRALPVVATAVVAGTIGAAVGAWWPRAETPKPVTRFSFLIPKGQIYTNNNRQMIAVSPDGSRIVYVAGLRLYLRTLSESDARAIPGSDLRGGVLNPVFSPDGEWIAFWNATDLKKIPVGGGTPITLYEGDETSTRFALTWDETGIVFPRSRGIVRVSPDGGAPVVLVPARDGEAIHRPQVLPGGRHVLYTSAPQDQLGAYTDVARIVVQPISSGEPTTVVQGVDARYLPTGHLLYRSGTTMMAVRFDPERLAIDGSPVAVAQAAAASGPVPLATHLDVSSSGTMVYVEGSGSAGQDLALLDRHGQITRRFGLPDGVYATPRVSPDGRYVAYADRGSDPSIWIVNLDGTSRPRRLTFSGRNRFPVWSADGQYLAFQSDRGGDQAIYWQRADGTGEAERLTTAPPGVTHAPEAFSPDGEHLLLRNVAGVVPTLSVWSRRDRSLRLVESGTTRAANATFSPDGRWIAYTATQSGQSVSVVRPFPLTAARYQVPIPEQSANMAIHPVWSRKVPELIYSVGPGLLATTTIDTRSAVEFGAPSVVQIPGTGDPVVRSWDLTPDAQHFIRIIEKELDGTLQPPIHVVMNWFEELKARLPER